MLWGVCVVHIRVKPHIGTDLVECCTRNREESAGRGALHRLALDPYALLPGVLLRAKHITDARRSILVPPTSLPLYTKQ